MIDENCLISVIVPVYKVEEYLPECIDSILAQTYKNFELILVDDGSPDNCPVICDEYAKKDSRVAVIHQENKGVSSARNVGIDVAKGEWIMFVDGDDWIENDMLEYLLSGDLSCDVITCGVKLYHKRLFGEKKMDYRVYNLCDKKDLFEILKMKKNELCGPVAKLYKKQCIKDNNIYFKEDVILAEDKIFNIEVFQIINKLQLLPFSKYNYRYNRMSASNKIDFEYCKGNKEYLEFCFVNNYNHIFDCNMFGSFFALINKIFSCSEYTWIQKKIQIKNILKEFPFDATLKNISIWHIDFRYWIIFLLLKCHFYFGVYAIYHIKELLKRAKYKLKG